MIVDSFDFTCNLLSTGSFCMCNMFMLLFIVIHERVRRDNTQSLSVQTTVL